MAAAIKTTVEGVAAAPAARKKAVPRKRVPAEERREQVLAQAADVIARDGMHAASTAEIARRSGISHAYLFRLFPTKEELLIAVAVENGRAMHGVMVQAGEAARGRGEDPLIAMGLNFQELLRDRTQLQVTLQAISAAASIPALGETLRAAWERVVQDIERISGAGPDETRAFMAQGMLLMMISGLGAEQSAWAQRLHHGPLPCQPGQMLGADASGGAGAGAGAGASASGAEASGAAGARSAEASGAAGARSAEASGAAGARSAAADASAPPAAPGD